MYGTEFLMARHQWTMMLSIEVYNVLDTVVSLL